MNPNPNLNFISFPSEKERQSHPLIKCIPQSVWDSWDLFYKQMPKAFIEIMQASKPEEVSALIKAFIETFLDDKQKENTKKEKYIIWLALAFSHPKWSSELMLVEFAQLLELEESDLLKLAIICRNHGYVDWLITRAQEAGRWDSLFAQHKNEFIGLAAKHGHIRLLDKFYLLLDDEQAVESALIAHNYQIVMDAAQYGHVPVLKFFMTRVSLQHCMDAIAVYSHMPYRLAAKEGHVPVLRYFNELFPQKTDLMFSTFNHEAVYWAACNGQIAVLRHWARTMGELNLNQILSRYAQAVFLSNLRSYDLEMILFLRGIVGNDPLKRCLCDFSRYRLLGNSLPAHFVSTEPKHRDLLLYIQQFMEQYETKVVDISDRAIVLEAMSQKAYDVIRYYTTTLSPIELQSIFLWIVTNDPTKLNVFLCDPASKDVLVFLLSFPEFWTEVVCPHKNNNGVVSAILSRLQQLHRMEDMPGELPLASERGSKAHDFLTHYCNESSKPDLNCEVDFLLGILAVKQNAMQSSPAKGLFLPIPPTRSLESRLLAQYNNTLSTPAMDEGMVVNECKPLIPAAPSSQLRRPGPPAQRSATTSPHIRFAFMSMSPVVASRSESNRELLHPKPIHPSSSASAALLLRNNESLPSIHGNTKQEERSSSEELIIGR